jgi:hypothetical protein
MSRQQLEWAIVYAALLWLAIGLVVWVLFW